MSDYEAYENAVHRMAWALHESCRLARQASLLVEPDRIPPVHGIDVHFGLAHDLVRRLYPGLDPTRDVPDGKLVRMSDELFAQLGASRVEWGEPDAFDVYNPTVVRGARRAERMT